MLPRGYTGRMASVTGIGGVFFKANDPEKLYQWYEKHLGIRREHGYVAFPWNNPEGMTAWSIVKKESDRFAPSVSSLMINYRVDDLDGLLEQLKSEGVEIDPKREDYDFGRFAWIMDPEGNRIELWEPSKGS
jgi:predicted enzyme related to lactoylglutathione lyase